MHFNLYIDDQTGSELNTVVERSGESRNSIIRQAIKAWITHYNQQWPDDILNFKGFPDMIPFENHRENLLSPEEDPFA